MANFEDQLSMHDEPSAQEMEEMMSQKAHELFELCDKEQKGFITKRDMQRLQSELPLSPDQLEAVFDSLDDDRNGFLTLEEFTGGFGSFLGLNPSEGVHEEEEGDANVYEELDDAVEEDRQFHQMMSNLGAANLFDDENTIKSVWSRIRRNEPEVVSNFEDFLYKISNEIRKSKLDFNTLESALKSKSSAHDQEVQKLYEEMEYQIKAEKERVLTEEQTKERQLREAMEQEIKDKDRQLQDLLMKHQEMEERLSELNLVEVETKQENDKLMKEKESLEELLLKSEENLEESKAYINQLRSQQRDEKRERAKAALKLTEGIALERESLVKQLDTLKDVNKKLRDDKDEAETRFWQKKQQQPNNLQAERRNFVNRDQYLATISAQTREAGVSPSHYQKI